MKIDVGDVEFKNAMTYPVSEQTVFTKLERGLIKNVSFKGGGAYWIGGLKREGLIE